MGNGLYAAKSRAVAYGASSPPRLVTVALLAKHRALACEHPDRPRDGLLQSGDGWSTDSTMHQGDVEEAAGEISGVVSEVWAKMRIKDGARLAHGIDPSGV